MATKRIFQLATEADINDIDDNTWIWMDEEAEEGETQEPSWKVKGNLFLKILNNFTTKFVPNVATVKDKLYWHDGELYVCNTAYTGNWVPGNFTATSIDELFERKDVVAALQTAVSALPSSPVKDSVEATMFEIVEDVTASYDMDAEAGKTLKDITGVLLTSASFNTSEAIPVDRTNLYAVRIKHGDPSTVSLVYYSDLAGTAGNGIACITPSDNNIVRQRVLFHVLVPPEGAKSFRISSSVDYPAKLYKIRFTDEFIHSALNKMAASNMRGDTLVVDADITSSLTITSLTRLAPNTGLVMSASGTACTSGPVVIDFEKKYALSAVYDQYRTPVVYYKDEDGLVFDSVQFPPVVSNTTISDEVLMPPPTAKSFRVCSLTPETLALKEVHYFFQTKDYDSDIEDLQEQVAELQSSAFLDQTIDTINAVKYFPERKIKLGNDIFNLEDASYDSTYWTVNGDTIEFSTTVSTNSEFDTGIVIPDGEVYYAEITISDYTRLPDIFTLKVGSDGPVIDVYDGTETPAHSLIGNGGTLRIVPVAASTLSFKLQFKISPVVTSGETREVTYPYKTVSCGNGDGTIVDAKWNVAIGPISECLSNVIGATRCIAIGYYALRRLKDGWQNIAIGTFAMSGLVFANRNISIGADSTYLFASAEDCTVMGRTALAGKGTGTQKAKSVVVIGNYAGKLNTASEENSVYIGFQCARSGIGTKCVCIGAQIPGYDGGGVNRIAIGYKADNNVDNTTVIGNTSIRETKVYGNLVVEGTDHVKRRIVFNNDNTVTWEVVS